MSYQEFTIKQNDKKPTLVATIKDAEGNLFDLSGVDSVYFQMRLRGSDVNKVNKTDTSYATVQGDGTTGKVQYLWQDGDTDTPGMYEAEFELVWSDGEIQHVPTEEPFIVNVVKDRIT